MTQPDVCASCGASLSPDQRFCTSCGAAAAERCPACGAVRVPGARFCGQCGTRLSSADEPSPIAPSPSPAALERKLVSVLFADLVGFTARSEARDPEEVREFLTRYFDLAGEIVRRYGGSVEKFIGDAVMAVWGTPAAHEDDAERAVRAALELVDVVQGLSPGKAERPQLRAAVMTGEAAVTLGATGQGMVAGDLVNTASRLQAAAPPGSVLVDETTERVAGRAIAFEPAGEQLLRGKSVPVEAWRALRVVAERGGVGRAEGLEPAFTGREEELRLLKEQIHATGREGRARLVSIIGQGGIGKSRLIWELRKYIDGLAEDIYWHEGRSPSYGEGVAFWAVGEMVRRRAGIAETEADETARAKLEAAVRDLVPEEGDRRWLAPRLGALLGLQSMPIGEREELFAAWRTFFEHVAARGTTVLVFDDLQWADLGVLDFIDHVLEWSRSRPILVVGLARPDLLERRPTWGSGPRTAVTLHLDPLDDDDIGGLLLGLAPGLPTATIQQVVRRAEGVPLYAVETLRMLLDEGRLVRVGDSYRLSDPDAEIAVPPTLQALITSRLDALDPRERTLVQDASVLGKSFTTAELAAVSGQPVEDIRAHLRSLVRKEILTLDADPRSPERGQHGFTQDAIREIAYGTLARRDRRSRHLAAARYFEATADQETSGVLATHYLEAWRATPEGPEADAIAAQARVALRAAIERALSLHANSAALGYIDQALTVTSDPADRAALWVLAADPAEAALGYGAAQDYLTRALEWYEEQGDVARANTTMVSLVRSLTIADDLPRAYELIERVVDRLDPASAPAQAASAYNELARIHLFVGRAAAAREAVDRGLAVAERHGLEREIAELFSTKSWAVDTMGRPREAVALAQAGVELSDALEHTPGRLRARMNLSNVLMVDNPARGLEVSRAGIEIAIRIGHSDWAASLAGNTGMAALLTGDWSRTLEQLRPLDRSFLQVAAHGALTGTRHILEAFSGIPVSQEHVETLSATLAESGAAQNRAFAHASLALTMFGLGRYDRVAGAVRAAREEMSDARETLVATVFMGRAALALRDRELAQGVVEAITAVWSDSGWTRVAVAELQAGVLALAGDAAQADAGFRQAIERHRALGLAPEVGIAIVEMLELLGTDRPAATELRAEAAAIAEALGYRVLRERLQALHAVPAEAAETRVVAG